MADAPKVEVYCAAGCGYCTGALSLLERKGVNFVEYRVDLQPERRTEMESRAQLTSVPQIFINDQHIGGFDDMVELDMDDELDPMLGLATPS